jgi:hypothetical protein
MNNGAERDNLRIRLEKQENIIARCMVMLEAKNKEQDEIVRRLEKRVEALLLDKKGEV